MGWIFKISQFFDYQDIPDHERLIAQHTYKYEKRLKMQNLIKEIVFNEHKRVHVGKSVTFSLITK